MFNFLKIFSKKSEEKYNKVDDFDIELTAVVIAYEIARSDGEITESELDILMQQIEDICKKTNKNKDQILKLVELHSKNSVSFHEYIEDINKNYSKEEKHSLIRYFWQTAYADGKLDVNEERLIRRIADLIKIKDIYVLKIKDDIKSLN